MFEIIHTHLAEHWVPKDLPSINHIHETLPQTRIRIGGSPRAMKSPYASKSQKWGWEQDLMAYQGALLLP